MMVTFVLAALVLIMMPGPDQALITRSALTAGRTGGLLTVLGGVLGLSVHATVAALGLSALLLASAEAFTVVKVVGAIYLLWLGFQALRPSRETQVAPRTGAFLRQGFLSNALNPKVALFFVTFLPQFLSTDGRALWMQALFLSVVFAMLYVAWFSGYVAAVDRIGRLLRKPRVTTSIERITGLLLVGFAIRLAVS